MQMNQYNTINVFQLFKLPKSKDHSIVFGKILSYLIEKAEGGVLMIEINQYLGKLAEILQDCF